MLIRLVESITQLLHYYSMHSPLVEGEHPSVHEHHVSQDHTDLG